MERTNIKSTQIIEKETQKYVRKYKKSRCHLYETPRTIPINIIMKLVNNSRVYTPKLLKNTANYIDLEYIKGIPIYGNLDKKVLIDTIINYIVYLNNLDCTKIKKYSHWNNNSEYLHYLTNYLSKTKKSFPNNTKIIIELLNIGNDELEKLKKYKLDDLRKMSLIHCNINYENMLLKFNRIYLLDWQLASYADEAYELATHFLLMDYTDDEKKYILNIISKKQNLNIQKLKRDIKIYTIYEIIKKIYFKINYITQIIKQDKNIDEELSELNDYYIYLSKLTKINTLPFNEIKEIFKNIK